MPAGSDDAQRARAEARADLIRRLFAVAISVGFAATLARMTWVQNGALPGPAELNQTLILGTALLAAVLGWESHLLAMAEKPLFGFSRFLVNLVLVFIYMFLLMASAHPECMLWTLAVIFALYVAWDVLTMREQIALYDPAVAGESRATAAQIRSVYAGGFTGAAHVAPGPAITLAWSGYFVLLACGQFDVEDERGRTQTHRRAVADEHSNDGIAFLPHRELLRPHHLRARAHRTGGLLDRHRRPP